MPVAISKNNMSMISSLLFSDRAPKVVRKSMDFNAQRAGIISTNIANGETPGYKAKSMEFESVLRSVSSTEFLKIKSTNSKHISPSNPDFGTVNANITTDTSQGRVDGNNVNLEKEMTNLAETRLAYDAAITAMSKRGAIIKSAITETR